MLDPVPLDLGALRRAGICRSRSGKRFTAHNTDRAVDLICMLVVLRVLPLLGGILPLCRSGFFPRNLRAALGAVSLESAHHGILPATPGANVNAAKLPGLPGTPGNTRRAARPQMSCRTSCKCVCRYAVHAGQLPGTQGTAAALCGLQTAVRSGGNALTFFVLRRP